jgi:hypothetical protein
MPLVARMQELQAEQRRETQWDSSECKILSKTRTVPEAMTAFQALSIHRLWIFSEV